MTVRCRTPLAAAAILITVGACSSAKAQETVNVPERSYNAFRTGANTAETILAPENVKSSTNQFHKRFVMDVDGKIEGSPLYASAINIAGGVHNVVYVATMHNTVFAFDADSGALLSTRLLGNPVTGSDLQTLKPTSVHREWGIAGAPIIDLATKTLFVVRWGYENGVTGPTYRLFGLNMSDLSKDRFPSALVDGYTVGGAHFNRFRQMQRAGLALATKPTGSKAVVIAFGGGEGKGSPPGWVVAFDTAKLASANSTADVWCSNPNNDAGIGGGAGIWMGNAAPAVDSNGDIYIVTGNGPYNPQPGLDQLGESVVHLIWTPGNPGSLIASDWFTPFRDVDRDAHHKDQDLASAGLIALPDETGLIAGGKDGVYYHVDRSLMGRRDLTKLVEDPFVASFDYLPWNGHTSLLEDLDQITSTDPITIGHVDRGRTPHIHGTAVYFDNLLFVHGENNAVHVFSRNNGHFGPSPAARGTAIASYGTSSPGGMPGGILSLSANGTANAILWENEAFGNLMLDADANLAPTPNVLRAYDVSTVATGTLQSIWDSEIEPNDLVGAATKFAPPLVANGKVYQATYDNRVIAYGLGPASLTPTRDIRRTVVFVHAQAMPHQELFVRGGGKGGNPIRIRHRNWLNQRTNYYRWGNSYLNWLGAEPGQATPSPDLGGGSPVDWTTSLAQGKDQPYVSTAGYGIADENAVGPDYWMLDVDMDCEQAFPDDQGRRWFELKAVMVTQLMTAPAPDPGWEGDIHQSSNPMPPYSSANHMGICGKVNVFVANFANSHEGSNPNSAQFLEPSYTYLSPIDERSASDEALSDTPCISPDLERRCFGNLAQTCQKVGGRTLFRSIQDCNSTPTAGDFVQMCQKSTGKCCTPPALGKRGNCW
jgi:hypothetical protein